MYGIFHPARGLPSVAAALLLSFFMHEKRKQQRGRHGGEAAGRMKYAVHEIHRHESACLRISMSHEKSGNAEYNDCNGYTGYAAEFRFMPDRDHGFFVRRTGYDLPSVTPGAGTEKSFMTYEKRLEKNIFPNVYL